MYHEHPLRILKYSAKNIWLLIFPLIRGIHAFRLDVNQLYIWLKGAWFDILVLGVILLFGYIQWYFSWITVTNDEIIHTSGVFVKMHTVIPYRCISSFTVEHAFYLRPFMGMRIYCNTSAGILNSSDMTFLVTKQISREILRYVPRVENKSRHIYKQNSNVGSIMLFSLFISSSLSGAIYIAALFFKGGSIMQDIISGSLARLNEESEKLSSKLIVRIPAVALTIGIILLIMWFFSFIVNLSRYMGFVVNSDKNTVEVSCGLVTRRDHYINTSHINYADLRQNLIMKLSRAVAINIDCPGYGGITKNLPLLLPIKMDRNVDGELENIGVWSRERNKYRPPIWAWLSYTSIPLTFVCMVFPVSDFLWEHVPQYDEFEQLFKLMVLVPSVWMIMIGITALFTSGITVNDKKIILRYSKGTTFHTIITDTDKLVKIRIDRNPFHHFNKRCNINFYFNQESQTRHMVRGIKYSTAVQIAEKLGYDSAGGVKKLDK